MTRFICSQDQAEVELVKKELFLAGIRSEIRSNPLAQALRVTRLELWLEDERDLFNASKLYAGLQGRSLAPANGKGNGHNPVPAKEPLEGYIELNEQGEKTTNPVLSGQAEPGAGTKSGVDELTEASALLEKEIEQMLERERELTATCASLRGEAEGLRQELARVQAELVGEKETRAAIEKTQATQIASLEQTLERERSERTRVETEARVAAEAKAAQAAAALKSAEKQLLEQKELQRRTYAQNLNTLRSKLQAQRNA